MQDCEFIKSKNYREVKYFYSGYCKKWSYEPVGDFRYPDLTEARQVVSERKEFCGIFSTNKKNSDALNFFFISLAQEYFVDVMDVIILSFNKI